MLIVVADETEGYKADVINNFQLNERRDEMEAIDVLKEFIDDVVVAYDSYYGGMDKLKAEWPDLIVTYKKALAVVEKDKK